nr:hypothetical protein [Oligoflexales bacterium]
MHGRISKVIFLTAITILVGSCRQDKIQLTGTCLKSSNSGAINWLYSSKHYLPWPSGLSYQITQTTGGATHNNLNPDNLKMLYAWDFGVTRVSGTKLPGDKVIAAINGTVAAIKRDSTIIGGGPEAKNDSNYVFINWDLEDSNEVRSGLLLQSQYRHFHSVSANLTVGKRVSRGTELGVAGCTGWCYGTHLH